MSTNHKDEREIGRKLILRRMETLAKIKIREQVSQIDFLTEKDFYDVRIIFVQQTIHTDILCKFFFSTSEGSSHIKLLMLSVPRSAN